MQRPKESTASCVSSHPGVLQIFICFPVLKHQLTISQFHNPITVLFLWLTTRSLSFRRQSMKDRFARLNWIFHIQVCLLHLIRKKIFEEAFVSWMSKSLSGACKIVQLVPLLGHKAASNSYSEPGLENCNDAGHISFTSAPLSSRERDRQ